VQVTWACRKNLSHILIERFLSRVVYRERNCSYVILETDQVRGWFFRISKPEPSLKKIWTNI